MTAKFTQSQCAEILDVYSGARSRADGSVRVRGISKAAKKFLSNSYGILVKIKGRYFPRKAGTFNDRAEYINPDWRDLPIEIVWHAVRSALDSEGSAGHSIVKSKVWDALNLRCKPQRENEVMDVLNELAMHGLIYFQFAGDVWCIKEKQQ
jgi:hypothetical protein